MWVKVIFLITLLTEISLVKGAIDYDDLDTARRYGLAQHNLLRQRHGSPPLVLDRNLTISAQDYSSKFGKTVNGIKYSGHSKEAKRGQFGENLYSMWGGKPNNISDYAMSAMNSWYSEICNYDFITHDKRPDHKGNLAGYGHFTAMIWKSSKLIGIGIYPSPKAITIVTQYKPAGNVQGRYRDEYLPPLTCLTYEDICFLKNSTRKRKTDAECGHNFFSHLIPVMPFSLSFTSALTSDTFLLWMFPLLVI